MESVKLTPIEKRAFWALRVTVKPKSSWGYAIADVIENPKPELIKAVITEIVQQWEDNPSEMFKMMGFFDLPKFLAQ
jgi:hypothetical protein